MLNIDRWRFYCKDFISPEIYIEFGFYAMIAAALQRRVWRGSLRKPLFPNTFTFLVGPPGVGKGLVVEEIEKILKHKELRMTDDDLKKDKLFWSMYANKQAKDTTGSIEYPSLIFTGPNATTYEFMVFDMMNNTKSFTYDGENGVKKFYLHASVCYCLDELGSLFRKNMDDLVMFLLQAYNCGDYKKSILSRAEDKITNCCLNLIAATQSSFIRKIATQELIDGGFVSRGFFVYAEENRHERAKPPEFNEEQIGAYNTLLKHIRQVALIFGECKFADDASAFLENWATQVLPERKKFVHERLRAIHARKAAGAQKLAMAVHYAEKLDNVVTLDECVKAVELLDQLDVSMLKCFVGQAKNPLDEPIKDVLRYIKANTKSGGISTNALWMEFVRELPDGKKSLDEILNFLLGTKQIKTDGNKYICQ